MHAIKKGGKLDCLLPVCQTMSAGQASHHKLSKLLSFQAFDVECSQAEQNITLLLA
jgi:hypothetical protein